MVNSGYISSNIQYGGLYPSQVSSMMQAPVQYIRTKDKNMKKAVWTQAFWLSPPWGRPRNLDYTELEPYENNIWLRMVVTHVIDSVIQSDWEIVPVDEEKGAADSHIDEVREFFQAKTWSESWQETLRRMLPDLLLYDAGTIVKVFPRSAYDKNGELKNPKAKPVELMARDGRSFLLDTDLFGKVTRVFQYSWVAPQAKPISFSKDEIIYMQMRPQSRSPYGIASLEIVKDVMDYLTAAISAQRKYYENNFPISGIIDHPDIVDPDELLKRAQMYKENLKGEMNTGKWLITAGGVKVTPLQISAQNMQWLQSSEFFGKLIFALFKVAPSELGFTDRLNRATAITQSQIYKQSGVRVVLSLLEEYINREIIWKHFATDVKFSFDDSLDLQDEKIRADIDHIRITDGVVTINEIRNREGKNEFEDEEFDKPFAAQAYQQKLMEAGMGGGEGEEGAEDHRYEYSEAETEGEEETPVEEAAVGTEHEKFEKAVMAETPMGEPGAALIPNVYDQKKRRKKEKELEDNAVSDLTRWSEEQQKKIEEELKRVYNQ